LEKSKIWYVRPSPAVGVKIATQKVAMINGGRFTVPQQTLIIKNNFFYSKTVSDVTSETVLIKKNIFKYKVTGRGRLCCPCLSLLLKKY